MSCFERSSLRASQPTRPFTFFAILIFTLTLLASSTLANIIGQTEKQDLSTITPEVTGLVLADPTRKVVDHPVDCPFYLPSFNSPPLEGILAIDLGISYTSAGYFKDDKFHYVLDNNGLPLIPSYVAIFNNPSTLSNNNTNTTQILFGQDAKDQLTTNPQNTIFNWQRLIRLPYGLAMIQIPAHVPTLRHLYRPEELTTLLVSHLKHLAETQAGINFTYAVVTIPSDDTPDQRHALDEAIEAAGLYGLRQIRRHLAPYLAYQLDRYQLDGDNVVMVNLDPEYLEVAVAEIDEGVYETMAILERTEVSHTTFQKT
ncbi:Heat shock 70 kDa protein 6 [Mortierella hygrophila]|uniref:Heat shock 70 kDa protein 6 n=1 Tax=Mortierella hygrophila TaxID=979708 RepID=A0A9P6FE09_9FUNG|nr:Heat shock 70 kDa protein 6 [Mortierella hygrophila]